MSTPDGTSRMSDATKVVIGTIVIAAVLVLGIVINQALV